MPGDSFRLAVAELGDDAAFHMLGDSPMRRETLARMKDTGVAVLDFGVFRLKGGVDPAAFEAVLESAAVLGAREAVVNGDEPDEMQAAPELRAAVLEIDHVGDAALGAAERFGVRRRAQRHAMQGVVGVADPQA